MACPGAWRCVRLVRAGARRWGDSATMQDSAQDRPDFGGLLRRLRIDAGLSQEELAEKATVSARSVSDLERGVTRTARPQTARLLAAALGLAGPTQVPFLAAARGQAMQSQHQIVACGSAASG